MINSERNVPWGVFWSWSVPHYCQVVDLNSRQTSRGSYSKSTLFAVLFSFRVSQHFLYIYIYIYSQSPHWSCLFFPQIQIVTIYSIPFHLIFTNLHCYLSFIFYLHLKFSLLYNNTERMFYTKIGKINFLTKLKYKKKHFKLKLMAESLFFKVLIK